MNFRSYFFLVLSIIAVCRMNALAQSAETLYQKGIQYEEVKGELEQAVSLFKEVLQKYPHDHAVAAKAQLHIGLCYERLGEESDQKAQEAFRAVIENYSDQPELVHIAQSKLKRNQAPLETVSQPETTIPLKHKRNSEIEEIRNTLVQYHAAYESKDPQKYYSYYSDEYLESFQSSEQSKGEAWIKRLAKKFSEWKTISIKSTIASIEKTGMNYVVTEKMTIKWTDYNGYEKPTKSTLIYTFKKENDEWKILDQKDISLPMTYDSLKNTGASLKRPGLVYVSHITHNIVSVIDPFSQKLIGTIKSGIGSVRIDFSSEDNRGYIANFSSNDVTVFDRKTGKSIATIAAGEHPSDIILTTDKKYLLISHESYDGIWVLDITSNKIVKKLFEGTGELLRIDKYSKIYQSQIFTPNVFVVDPRTLIIRKKISVGGRPLHIALSPDQRYAYVANCYLNELEKIDVERDSVVGRISDIDTARGIAISPDGKFAYVTNVVSSGVTIVNLENDSIVKKITVGRMPTCVAFRLDGKYAYVSCQGNSSISVIDTDTREVIQSIAVADNPINVQVK
jgi:YVTN family beta-propeller protein